MAAALLFSTGGAALKAGTFGAMQLSGLRSAVAALTLLVWARGRVTCSRATVAGGIAYAATVTSFVMANRSTTAANAIFLQSSAPLYLVLLAPWLLGERFRTRDVPFLVVLGAGMWLALSGTPHASRTAPDPALGNLVALGSGLTWALTLASLRRAERGTADTRGTGLSIVILGNGIAAAAALPFVWPLPSATPWQWLTVLYLGVFQIGMAYGCLTVAVRRLPALEASLLLLLEPALNPVWTWLVHGEAPGRRVIAGGAAIIATTAIRAVLLERQRPPLPAPAPMPPSSG